MTPGPGIERSHHCAIPIDSKHCSIQAKINKRQKTIDNLQIKQEITLV